MRKSFETVLGTGNLFIPLLGILLAFGLRALHLDLQSLWADEGQSIYRASQDLPTIVSLSASGIHPPLYDGLLHFWMLGAGTTEFSTRFLSLFFGTLAVALIFAVGRAFLGQGAALLAMAAAVFSPLLVYYSQETRMYSPTLFFSLLSMWFYLRALRSAEGMGWKLGYVAAAALAVYSHYYAWLIVGFQNVFFLLWAWVSWEKGRSLSRLAHWALAQLALIVLYIPWLGVLLDKYRGYVTPSPGPDLLIMLYQTVVSFGLGYSGGQAGATPGQASILPDRWIALALALGLLLIAGAGLRRSGVRGIGWPSSGPQRLLLEHALLPLYLALPVLEIVLLSWAKRDFAPRYLFFAAPAYYLLLGKGLATFWDRRWAAGALGLIFLSSTSAFSLHNYYFDPNYWRDNHRGVAQFVSQQLREGDAIILNAPYLEPTFSYYYRGPAPVKGLPGEYPPDPQKTLATVREMVQTYQRIWLVLWQDYYSDPQQVVERGLDETALRSGHWQFLGNIALVKYLTRPPLLQEVPLDGRDVRGKMGGQIELTAYRLGKATFRPGEALSYVLYWRALREVPEDYTVFVHLVDDQGNTFENGDSQPLGGSFPTSRWPVGPIIEDERWLPLPGDLPQGEYYLDVGMYELNSMKRLGEGAPEPFQFRLGPIQVR